MGHYRKHGLLALLDPPKSKEELERWGGPYVKSKDDLRDAWVNSRRQSPIRHPALECECRDAPAPLTVTSQQTVTIGDQLAATILDFAPGANIAPFGTCKILTAAASGTPTPCVPATVTPWIAGATSPVSITMPLGLLDSDRLVCTVAASPCISVSDPGPTDTQDT